MRQRVRHTLFIGKIDLAFNHGQSVKDFMTPALINSLQSTTHLSECLQALRLAFGIYQISQTFNLGQIHTAILKRPAGKLSGPRLPETKIGQGFRQGR